MDGVNFEDSLARFAHLVRRELAPTCSGVEIDSVEVGDKIHLSGRVLRSVPHDEIAQLVQLFAHLSGKPVTFQSQERQGLIPIEIHAEPSRRCIVTLPTKIYSQEAIVDPRLLQMSIDHNLAPYDSPHSKEHQEAVLDLIFNHVCDGLLVEGAPIQTVQVNPQSEHHIIVPLDFSLGDLRNARYLFTLINRIDECLGDSSASLTVEFQICRNAAAQKRSIVIATEVEDDQIVRELRIASLRDWAEQNLPKSRVTLNRQYPEIEVPYPIGKELRNGLRELLRRFELSIVLVDGKRSDLSTPSDLLRLARIGLRDGVITGSEITENATQFSFIGHASGERIHRLQDELSRLFNKKITFLRQEASEETVLALESLPLIQRKIVASNINPQTGILGDGCSQLVRVGPRVPPETRLIYPLGGERVERYPVNEKDRFFFLGQDPQGWALSVVEEPNVLRCQMALIDRGYYFPRGTFYRGLLESHGRVSSEFPWFNDIQDEMGPLNTKHFLPCVVIGWEIPKGGPLHLKSKVSLQRIRLSGAARKGEGKNISTEFPESVFKAVPIVVRELGIYNRREDNMTAELGCLAGYVLGDFLRRRGSTVPLYCMKKGLTHRAKPIRRVSAGDYLGDGSWVYLHLNSFNQRTFTNLDQVASLLRNEPSLGENDLYRQSRRASNLELLFEHAQAVVGANQKASDLTVLECYNNVLKLSNIGDCTLVPYGDERDRIVNSMLQYGAQVPVILVGVDLRRLPMQPAIQIAVNHI